MTILEIIKKYYEIEFWEGKDGNYIRITSKTTQAHCTIKIETKEEYEYLKEKINNESTTNHSNDPN